MNEWWGTESPQSGQGTRGWKVGKGLSAKPRGLNLEIIFYYCFKKICASYGFILSPFWKDTWFPKWWEEGVRMERIQFLGWQVSTLVHENKTDKVSCEAGESSIRFDCPEPEPGDPVYKRPSYNPDIEKESLCLSIRIRVHPCSEPWSLCLSLIKPVCTFPEWEACAEFKWNNLCYSRKLS